MGKKNSKLRVRFRHLTQYQKDIICNGCGPKGGLIKPPDFLFLASCNHHDFNYWIGCNKLHRKKADLQFYREMLKDVNNAPKEKQNYYRFWAKSYYRAVRIFGWFCFHWASRQRDLYDLIKLTIQKEV